MSYVYEYPYDVVKKDIYIKAFINSIIMCILDFAEKLIDLNVYAVHPIIEEIIGYYTRLDEINSYVPADYGFKRLYIV